MLLCHVHDQDSSLDFIILKEIPVLTTPLFLSLFLDLYRLKKLFWNSKALEMMYILVVRRRGSVAEHRTCMFKISSLISSFAYVRIRLFLLDKQTYTHTHTCTNKNILHYSVDNFPQRMIHFPNYWPCYFLQTA